MNTLKTVRWLQKDGEGALTIALTGEPQHATILYENELEVQGRAAACLYRDEISLWVLKTAVHYWLPFLILFSRFSANVNFLNKLLGSFLAQDSSFILDWKPESLRRCCTLVMYRCSDERGCYEGSKSSSSTL